MALIHRILKQPLFGRYHVKWCWPEGICQEGWEAISIKSDSGADLGAVFGAAHAEKVLGAIVLAHPMGKAAKGFWLKNGHADLFRKAGYHVLAFDFNGFGDSDSSTFDYPSDVISAGKYLKNQFTDLDIIVVGASFGAIFSICALSRTEQPFKAAVLEAAFPTLSDFWHRYPFPQFMLSVSKVVYPPWERELRPIRAASSIKGNPSILLIYGDADEYSPPSCGKQLLQVMCQHTDVVLWVVEGGTHTCAYRESPDLYRERVLGFLEAVLSGNGKAALHSSSEDLHSSSLTQTVSPWTEEENKEDTS